MEDNGTVGGSDDRRTRRRRGRRRGEGGVALVEFAIVAPVLFLILIGIAEFGWVFFQKLDVRHGAREGARLVAVNYRTSSSMTGATQTQTIRNEICRRLEAGPDSTVNLALQTSGEDDQGDLAVVTVTFAYEQLTGFLDPWLGSVGSLTSSVQTRLEQDATWDATLGPVACPVPPP